MQNPRDAKKASLRYFKLQRTPRYLTIQYLCKKASGCLNLPKVQWEFCQRATNQQKKNGEAFFQVAELDAEFPFYLTWRTQQQFIGNVSVGMELRRQSLLTKNFDRGTFAQQFSGNVSAVMVPNRHIAGDCDLSLTHVTNTLFKNRQRQKIYPKKW